LFKLLKHLSFIALDSKKQSASISRAQGGISRFYYRIEPLRIVHGDFTEHLTIQCNIGFLATVNELTVADAPLPARRAQAGNPEPPKIAFAAFAVDPGVDVRPYGGLFGQPIQVARRTAMAFYGFEDSFLRLVPCGAFSNSWHVSFPL
jgi:hypothetical protein